MGSRMPSEAPSARNRKTLNHPQSAAPAVALSRAPRIVFFMFPHGAGPDAQGPDDGLNAVARRLLSFHAVGRSVWTRGMVRGGVAASRRPTTAPDGSDPRDRGRLFLCTALQYGGNEGSIRLRRGSRRYIDKRARLTSSFVR